MYKNKKYLFLFSILLFASSAVNVFASASISSLLLNGVGQSITFNPNNGESVSIEVRSTVPVKFTRMYICSTTQVCNGTSGNYTRYFTQSDVSDTISKVWNGKKSGDTEIVQDGEYKVMVSMTEGTNDPALEFGPYSIFVSSNSSASSTNQYSSSSSENTNNTNSTSTPNISYITKTVYASAHSDPEELSNYTENILNTSAGRSRMAIVGSKIDFNAKYSISSKIQCTPYFRWIFGDGFDSTGKIVSHIYKHSGEYNVVLNTSCGEYSSVSRTIVRVSKPDIGIIMLNDGAIQINNKSNTEINIGGWKIRNEQKDFVLPTDTIMTPKGNIVLLKEDVGITEDMLSVSIVNQLNREVALYIKEVKNIEVVFKQEQVEPNITVEQAEYLLAEYKKSVSMSKISKESPKNVENKDYFQKKDPDNTATVLNSVDNSNKQGFWSRVMSVPISNIKGLIDKFYSF